MPLIRKGSGAPPATPGDTGAESLGLLTAGSSEERWTAARAAGDVPGGVAALGDALALEADRRVREAIFTSLVRAGSSAAVLAVLPHLRSDDASLRTGALDALRAMPGAVGPHLPALLSDEDADVRLLVCEIARGLPAAEATLLLCELIDTERQANVCAAAVDVLAEVGGPEALPALARCAARFSGEPFLGFSIKIAAERIGSQADPARE